MTLFSFRALLEESTENLQLPFLSFQENKKEKFEKLTYFFSLIGLTSQILELKGSIRNFFICGEINNHMTLTEHRKN